MILKRWLESQLIQKLKYYPAIVLIGARQVGKTTLSHEISLLKDSIYLDLERESDLIKLNDPVSFFERYSNKLIILDEIQRMPQLFEVLRGVIDENRRKGKKAGQFLLLGSASMQILAQSSESLTGRVCFIELFGLNMLEIEGSHKEDLLWFQGGFPESHLSENSQICFDKLSNQIRTYIEKDALELGGRFSTRQLGSLWKMIAHSQGEVLNYSKLASNLQVDTKTIIRYVDIFEKLLLVRKLAPWSSNPKKTVVKSPRTYVRDSGLLHCLLGIYQYDSLLSHPVLGKSWEGFVIENVHSILPYQIETFFYRARSGAEIDLLLKFPNSDLWAIEIKRSTTPKIERGFYEACEYLNVSHQFLVYSGHDDFPLNNNTWVFSLIDMMNKVQNEINKQLNIS